MKFTNKGFIMLKVVQLEHRIQQRRNQLSIYVLAQKQERKNENMLREK